MSTEPSVQNSNSELKELFARAELQLGGSQKIVAAFLELRGQGEEAINGLIQSNNELTSALRLAAQKMGIVQDSDEMKLCLSIVPPRILNQGKYFERANGKVLLELCKANCLGLDGVTLSEIVAATGCAQRKVKEAIGDINNYTLRPNLEYATETGKTYEIKRIAKDKWALVKRQSEEV